MRYFLNVFVFAYLDDILIFSYSLKEHICNVLQVLQKLLANNLYVKGEKCEFQKMSVFFLSFTISPSKIEMESSNYKGVLEWPTLTSRQALANFYIRFVSGLPLHSPQLHQAPLPVEYSSFRSLFQPQAQVLFCSNPSYS